MEKYLQLFREKNQVKEVGTGLRMRNKYKRFYRF